MLHVQSKTEYHLRCRGNDDEDDDDEAEDAQFRFEIEKFRTMVHILQQQQELVISLREACDSFNMERIHDLHVRAKELKLRNQETVRARKLLYDTSVSLCIFDAELLSSRGTCSSTLRSWPFHAGNRPRHPTYAVGPKVCQFHLRANATAGAGTHSPSSLLHRTYDFATFDKCVKSIRRAPRMSRQNKQDVYEMRVQKAALENDLGAIQSILEMAKNKRVSTPLLGLARIAIMLSGSLGFLNTQIGIERASGVRILDEFERRGFKLF